MQDAAHQAYREMRMAHWNRWAEVGTPPRWLGEQYHARLQEVYRRLVPRGASVLEIGAGDGGLLAVLEPSVGVGVDFAPRMVELAKARHPHLEFLCADVYELELDRTFDYIVISDTLNDLWDVQALFEKLRSVVTPSTRLVMNTYSRLWGGPLKIAMALGMARTTLPQNWLTVGDVDNLFQLADFEMLSHWEEVLWPAPPKALAALANKYLVRFPPFHWLAMTNFMLARPSAAMFPRQEKSVSVIVAARNEAGHIRDIFKRIPEFGSSTELIFVEGGSTDDTYATIEQTMQERPERKCSLFRQTGKGKGDAVRLGFAKATGDVLMILDADMTVAPESLPLFYEALVSNKGEFVNGVRLVYPMEKEAMRFFNLLGNKCFSWAFSWLLGQRIRDTLCGTKVLSRENYERIAANRSFFGDFDPFGDFDLLFGAAKLNFKIVELPIRYRHRVYGDTNISRWRHGLLLLRMAAFAMKRLKFV